LFVSLVNASGNASRLVEGFSQCFGWGNRMVLGEADKLEQRARSFAGILDANRGQGKFQRGLLIICVINGEITRQAETGGFAAKQAAAERVEGADGRFAQGIAGTFEQGAD